MLSLIERHHEKVAAEAERARLTDRARLEEALAPYVRPWPDAAHRSDEIDLRDAPRTSRPLRVDRSRAAARSAS